MAGIHLPEHHPLATVVPAVGRAVVAVEPGAGPTPGLIPVAEVTEWAVEAARGEATQEVRLLHLLLLRRKPVERLPYTLLTPPGPQIWEVVEGFRVL